jgi:hypothetical protein
MAERLGLEKSLKEFDQVQLLRTYLCMGYNKLFQSIHRKRMIAPPHCEFETLCRETPARATGGVFLVSSVNFVLDGGFLGILPYPSSLDLISTGSMY